MERATTTVLPDLGYGKTAVTTTISEKATLSMPRTTAADAGNPVKFDTTTTIDDEDLFLGDDSNDVDVDADVDVEEEDDEYDDFDEDYFSSTYRPLSNLPTPPPSSHTSLAHSPEDHSETLESSLLLGPAVHLVNMLPPAASLATPSVALVQAMLARAQLPLDTVALAVCILDSLDSRFARTWRLSCPLGAPTLATAPSAPSVAPTTPAEKRHTLPSPLSPSFPFPDTDRLLHIDAVFPEVIILAALVIAAKFTDDGAASQQPAQAYCAAWGAPTPSVSASQTTSSASTSTGPGPCALWTGAQLATTERCIMQNLGYRILPLLDADLLADAQADMRRAGVQALRSRTRAASTSASTSKPSSKMPRKAVIFTPPEEALVEGSVSPIPPPAGNLTLGLGLMNLTAPSTDDKVDPITLTLPSKAQRRHVSSHSECFGRFAAYEL
ncbi:hypothetical protein SEUCBS139899_001192 [Sporothrix eucalyptigena]|uniref:Cyclin N-terminal domain-containing protein n=1 Tax=Sporothrix eucalyptigena TaxID=1812306 RepID=A0ABP0BS70_9PEZI